MLSLVIALFLNIPIVVINIFFKSKKKLKNFLGFAISFIIKIGSTFMIITSSAILGVEDSNVWGEQFITVLLID